jgi:arabinan endo-1,5-alpha-L-arabinosidase
MAGERFRGGTFEIESERRGYALELAVDFVRMAQDRERFWQIDTTKMVKPIANQKLSEVADTWPAGDIPVRLGDYMFRPHQRWTVEPVSNAGGYLGGPYFKIVIAGTQRALCATADRELSTVPVFSGDDSQLWRIEQTVDGTFRMMPKRIPGQHELNTRYVLYSAGDSTPSLSPWDFGSDNAKWNFRSH